MHHPDRYMWKCWCRSCCITRRNGIIVALGLLTGLVIGITTASWNYYGGWK